MTDGLDSLRAMLDGPITKDGDKRVAELLEQYADDPDPEIQDAIVRAAPSPHGHQPPHFFHWRAVAWTT